MNYFDTFLSVSASAFFCVWTTTTSSFSPFGVGSEGGFAAVVLPVELLDFKGKYTEGSITIDNGGLTMDNIAVYNHVGQLVLTNNGVNRLDLSALPSGLYFVQVKAGGETVTEKVFKR